MFDALQDAHISIEEFVDASNVGIDNRLGLKYGFVIAKIESSKTEANKAFNIYGDRSRTNMQPSHEQCFL